jgi:hypothetical protein
MRTLLIAVVVLLVGVALHWHMADKIPVLPSSEVGGQSESRNQVSERGKLPFELTISAEAKRVLLRRGETTVVDERHVVSGLRGNLPAGEEAIFLEIEWADGASAPRYFAKLRVDPPGRESVERVFDSAAGIEDLWEMP